MRKLDRLDHSSKTHYLHAQVDHAIAVKLGEVEILENSGFQDNELRRWTIVEQFSSGNPSNPKRRLATMAQVSQDATGHVSILITTEDEGLVHHDMPSRIFARLRRTKPQSRNSEEWREACLDFQQAQRRKKDLLRQLRSIFSEQQATDRRDVPVALQCDEILDCTYHRLPAGKARKAMCDYYAVGKHLEELDACQINVERTQELLQKAGLKD